MDILNVLERCLLWHLPSYPTDSDLWMSAADLERESGTPESLYELLSKAVKNCPEDETLWLMAAKEKWRRSKDALTVPVKS